MFLSFGKSSGSFLWAHFFRWWGILSRFYSWYQGPVLHRIYEKMEVELPDEEGLYMIYFGVDQEEREWVLQFIKNPEPGTRNPEPETSFPVLFFSPPSPYLRFKLLQNE